MTVIFPRHQYGKVNFFILVNNIYLVFEVCSLVLSFIFSEAILVSKFLLRDSFAHLKIEPSL